MVGLFGVLAETGGWGRTIFAGVWVGFARLNLWRLSKRSWFIFAWCWLAAETGLFIVGGGCRGCWFRVKSRGEKRFRLRRRSRVSRGSRLGRGVVVVSWVAGVGNSGGLVEVVGLDMVGGVVIAIDPAGGNCSLSCCSRF